MNKTLALVTEFPDSSYRLKFFAVKDHKVLAHPFLLVQIKFTQRYISYCYKTFGQSKKWLDQIPVVTFNNLQHSDIKTT